MSCKQRDCVVTCKDMPAQSQKTKHQRKLLHVPGTTEKIPQQNHKKLFCNLHSGPKHISQLSKALLTLNKELLMHTLNCTWITRYINNIMFSMWLAFFIKVRKPVPELFYLMNFSGLLLTRFFAQIKPSLE